MKTLLRALILLCLIVWLGAELFFPAVAGITFATLSPDTHTAGRIVGSCLRLLHVEGLAAGVLLILLLATARLRGVYSRRAVFAPMVLLALMLALTLVSQFGIMPRMETYRIRAGGAIDLAAPDDPARVAFNRLHRLSTHVEEGVLLLGLATLVLLARADSGEEEHRH